MRRSGQALPKVSCGAMNLSCALSDALFNKAQNLQGWLFEAALPLWWRVGADHALGGYHERIDFDGRSVILPRRLRVAARQAFCYSEAGRLGWIGPWREAGQHTLNFLRQRFSLDEGTVVSPWIRMAVFLIRRSTSTIRPLPCWLTPAVTARSIRGAAGNRAATRSSDTEARFRASSRRISRRSRRPFDASCQSAHALARSCVNLARH